ACPVLLHPAPHLLHPFPARRSSDLVAFLFAGPADPLTLFGSNVVFALFHLLGSNLRHSHIWWSFGPTLSRILISPAQHQIHHSKDRKSTRLNSSHVKNSYAVFCLER